MTGTETRTTPKSFDVLVESLRQQGGMYQEFLRVPALSAGIYLLPAGGVDLQSPHSEDEIYHVVRGRGKFTSGETEEAVGPGDLLFVPAGRPHRFHSVEEELAILVIFGPAESRPTGSPTAKNSDRSA
jgi:mannose-6-phosphate isomerase-like protein (cupin superfamily)